MAKGTKLLPYRAIEHARGNQCPNNSRDKSSGKEERVSDENKSTWFKTTEADFSAVLPSLVHGRNPLVPVSRPMSQKKIDRAIRRLLRRND